MIGSILLNAFIGVRAMSNFANRHRKNLGLYIERLRLVVLCLRHQQLNSK